MIPHLNTTRADPWTIPLSRRELEVLALASNGLSNQEIAERLCVSVETVRSHVSHARAKLGCHSRGHACCEALRRGLIP